MPEGAMPADATVIHSYGSYFLTEKSKEAFQINLHAVTFKTGRKDIWV